MPSNIDRTSLAIVSTFAASTSSSYWNVTKVPITCTLLSVPVIETVPTASETIQASDAHERAQHRLQLGPSLGPLGRRVRTGDDADPRVERGRGAVDLCSAQRDDEVAVAAAIDPAARPGVPGRGRGLESLNRVQCRGSGSSRDGGRRMQRQC